LEKRRDQHRKARASERNEELLLSGFGFEKKVMFYGKVDRVTGR
jgi:hypothetical protein